MTDSKTLKVISYNMLNPRHGIAWGVSQAYDIINGEKISNWEVRLAKFKEFLEVEKPDIVLLQEAPGFAKNEIASLMNCRVGNIKKSDLSNKNTAILIKDIQDYSKIKTLTTNSDKTVIQTIIKGKSCILASLHLKGYDLSTNEEKQILGFQDLKSVLTTLNDIDSDIKIVGGDYNEHVRAGAKRHDLMIGHGYSTQIDYNLTELNANTVIDGIFNIGLKQVKSYAVDIGASDHCAVIFEYKL